MRSVCDVTKNHLFQVARSVWPLFWVTVLSCDSCEKNEYFFEYRTEKSIKMLKQHLDMIGRNEPVQRKAKFWQSYVRALKGTDDMRAPEQTHYSKYPSRGIFRPVLNVDYPTWPSLKSIYDDPVHPSERINVPGYRYLPISRETYGISPRNLYPHNYSSPRYGDVPRHYHVY